MVTAKNRASLEEIAARVVERMDDLIAAMQDAAEQVSSGRALEDVPKGDYRLRLERADPGSGQSQAEAVVCAMEFEEYYRILHSAASELGLCLDETEELEVSIPDAEFGENMITGGFGNFKGISVELVNESLEELLEAVCCRLKARGLAFACVPDEDVIFYLPLARRAKVGMKGIS